MPTNGTVVAGAGGAGAGPSTPPRDDLFRPAAITRVVVFKASDLSKESTRVKAAVCDVLGGTPAGSWEVLYTSYAQTQPPETRLQQRHNKRPAAARADAHVPYLQVVTLPGIQPFFVARNKATVQSDAKLEPLLAASMGVAKKRLAGSIEGARYRVGDFSVGIGIIKINGTYRNLVVEVSYGPCVSVAAGSKIVADFAFSLGDPEKQVIMSTTLPGSDQKHKQVGYYTHAHTAYQYLQAFNMT